MVAVEFFFTFLKAKMRSQNAGLGLKGSNYGASSSDSYKDKLKKLVCYSVAGHFAPCRVQPFQSLRFELDKGETTLVLLKETRHQKSNQMNNLAQRIPSVFSHNPTALDKYLSLKLQKQGRTAKPSLYYMAIQFLKKLWYCDGGRDQNKSLVLSNELIKVELPPWKIWKAEVSSVSPLSQPMAKGGSDEGLTFEGTAVTYWGI